MMTKLQLNLSSSARPLARPAATATIPATCPAVAAPHSTPAQACPPDDAGHSASPLSPPLSEASGEAGFPIRISKARRALLRKLVARAGEPVTFGELNVNKGCISTQLHFLRKQLPEPTKIYAVTGVGYFVTPAHAEILRKLVDGDAK